METNDITCDYVHSFRDMDGSWTSAPCTRTATMRIQGYDVEGPVAIDDDGSVDVFSCAEHVEAMTEDVVDLHVDVITVHYRQGYAQGAYEGDLAPMSTGTAMLIHYEGISEADPVSGFDARTPLSGEWANEAVDWDDAEVEAYRAGFTRGWYTAVQAHAGRIVEADLAETLRSPDWGAES